MKLLDIFEQESPSPLQPGEKRERKDISIRDLRAIDAKLSNLQDSLHDSEYLKYKFAQDKALQDALAGNLGRVRGEYRRNERAVEKLADPAGWHSGFFQTV